MFNYAYLLLFIVILYSGDAETKTRPLFSKYEKKELDYLKSKEFLNENFSRYIKQQSRKRLDIFITNASKAYKLHLTEEVKSGAWKAINIRDENKMMNKLLNKEINRLNEERKFR